MTEPSTGTPAPPTTCDGAAIAGIVTWELRDESGQVKDFGYELSTSTRQTERPA